MSISRIACVLGVVSMLGACQTMEERPKETIGTLLGAAAGAVLGSNLGGGKGNTLAVALGTLAGAWLGSEVGKSMDEQDRMILEDTTQEVLENSASGETSNWSNPDSGNSGTVTANRTYYEPDASQPCREYTSTVTIDGKLETITGTACRRPDGTWHTID